jgi:hypothetical protein
MFDRAIMLLVRGKFQILYKQKDAKCVGSMLLKIKVKTIQPGEANFQYFREADLYCWQNAQREQIASLYDADLRYRGYFFCCTARKILIVFYCLFFMSAATMLRNAPKAVICSSSAVRGKRFGHCLDGHM